MLYTCDDLCVQEALSVFERVKISVCNYGRICYLVNLGKSEIVTNPTSVHFLNFLTCSVCVKYVIMPYIFSTHLEFFI
jgi:hypothetical protein